jgi:hypothetical protein
MFKTCIYCSRQFAGNQVVENFPVGRRLAFDGEKGRLWVICEYCRRWNLSPLDERWEAIEECERQFYDTSQSFSTENIGLARLPEGLELVRIGRPKRREFASWRYGREFIRRRFKAMIVTGTQIAVSVGAALAGADIWWFFVFGGKKKVIARVRDENGKSLSVIQKDLALVELARGDAPGGWTLKVPYRPIEDDAFFGGKKGKGKRESALLSGPTAIRAAGRIMPKVNSWGGTEAQVKHAVALIEDARSPERLFERLAAKEAVVRTALGFEKDGHNVKKMDPNIRLALEMAAHEESERRALEGELELLEAAWRDAEEIASIADKLLIPERVEEAFLKLKREVTRKRSSDA